MTTVGEIINGALRLIGQLAEGETPSADTANDALVSFNQMLDSWSTESLAIYHVQEQAVFWPAGFMSRTFGPTGDIVGDRPTNLLPSSYFLRNGISFEIVQVSDIEYSNIARKENTSNIPSIMFVDYDMPNVRINLFPVPTETLEFRFRSPALLSQAGSLTTELVFPPGYLKAVRYSLAVELAPEFGVDLRSGSGKTVAIQAEKAKRNIKFKNRRPEQMQMPSQLINKAGKYNIFSGNY